jgi:TetR/AcrR family transcriptional regulator, cholesterol catabolism regulator
VAVDDANRRRWPEVVDAAAKVFQEKGYRNATVQDVADALGILKGSLYHYIRSKEDLLFAVALDAHKSSLAMIEHLNSLDVDPASELAQFVRAHMGLLLREQIKIAVFLTEFGYLTEEHYHEVADSRRDYSHYVEDLIRRGQASEVFSSDVDPAIATLGLLGMLNWSQEWYRKDGNLKREDIIRGFLELALRSVGVNERTLRRLVAQPPSIDAVPGQANGKASRAPSSAGSKSVPRSKAKTAKRR